MIEYVNLIFFLFYFSCKDRLITPFMGHLFFSLKSSERKKFKKRFEKSCCGKRGAFESKRKLQRERGRDGGEKRKKNEEGRNLRREEEMEKKRRRWGVRG